MIKRFKFKYYLWLICLSFNLSLSGMALCVSRIARLSFSAKAAEVSQVQDFNQLIYLSVIENKKDKLQESKSVVVQAASIPPDNYDSNIEVNNYKPNRQKAQPQFETDADINQTLNFYQFQKQNRRKISNFNFKQLCSDNNISEHNEVNNCVHHEVSLRKFKATWVVGILILGMVWVFKNEQKGNQESEDGISKN